MAQSLSQLYLHITFHVKSTSVLIRDEDSADLYAYIGCIIKDLDSFPIMINGLGDHIHIFCIMSKNISLAAFMEDVKRHSSRWIKTKSDYYATFAWQGGYGGFTVSPSLCEKTRQYIANQAEHHKRMTFKEEYMMFLKEYGIDYNEDYLWND